MSGPRLGASLGGFGVVAGSVLYRDILGNLNRPAENKARSQTDAQQETRLISRSDGTQVAFHRLPSRLTQLERLKNETFDILVIGGGCVGAGVALDAQTRGLKTALVEGSDFASGTSGRSTKLIHGGVRYLETAFLKLDYGSFELVKEALEERAHMLAVAPYMNHALPIMIPVYKWWQVPYLYAGTKAYDLVASSHKAVPSSYFMFKERALEYFPILNAEKLKGALVYYDGQMNDTRMAIMIALTSAYYGAAIANQVKVTELVKGSNGQVEGAKVHDSVSDESWTIKAKSVVNATGVFADSIRKLDDPNAHSMIEPAAGVHLMFPANFSPSRMGLIVPKTSDGRVLFLLPWEGCTVAGTTDTPSEISTEPEPTVDAAKWIITETNRYLSKPVANKDVIAAWSGLRPLVKDPTKIGQGTKSLSRNHVIEVSPSKLVTITGGKWTTYRRMAQDTVDRLLKEKPDVSGGTAIKCKTWNMPLLGTDESSKVLDKKFDITWITLRNDYDLPEDVATHLTHCYGTRALRIAEIVKEGFSTAKPKVPERLATRYPFLEAEVVFAVQEEYAVHATDILARRTRLAFLDADATKEALPKVVQIMGDHLKWSKKQRDEEIEQALDFFKTMQVDKEGLTVR